MPKLYLRVLTEARPLPDDEGYDLQVQWLIAENDGSARGFGVTDFRGLQDVADPNVEWLQDPDNTVVFVPAQFVLAIDCVVPGRSVVQIRRALPFAVEEFVAEDIESMHIAHAPIKAGDPVACTLVNRGVLQSWLDCFAAAGVNAGTMITDADMQLRSDTHVTVLFDEGDALITHGSEAALIPQAHLGLALASIEAETLTVVGGSIAEMDLAQMPNKVDVETVAFDDRQLLGFLADRYNRQAPRVNLLQGEFRPVRPRSASSGKLRGIAALAALWLVIAFLGLVVRGFWAEREADRLETASFEFYGELFPRESQPVNLDQVRRRMASKLGRSVAGEGSAGAFLTLVDGLSRALNDKHVVENISYSDARGELNVEVLLDGYPDIENIKEALSRNGVNMTPVSAEQVPEGVRSRMRLGFNP